MATFTISADAFIHNNNGTTYNGGTAAVLYAGALSATAPYESYWQFDLGSIPMDATITAATFSVYNEYTSSKAGTLVVNAVTGAWTETGITWGTKPTNTAVTGQSSFALAATAGVRHNLDLVPTVQYLVDNGLNSVMFKSADGFWGYTSREGATAANHPTLEITYDTTPVAVDATVLTTPGTASALAVDPAFSVVYEPNTFETKLVTQNAVYDVDRDITIGSASQHAYFQLDLSGLPTNPDDISSAVFHFDVDTNGSTTYEVRDIDVSWAENTAPSSMGTTVWASGTYFDSTTSSDDGNYNTVDLTELVREWVSGARVNNGFALRTATYSTVAYVGGREMALSHVSDRPFLDVAYYTPPVETVITTTPGTASAIAVDPALTTTGNVTATTTPATASGLMVDPVLTATTDPNVTFTANVATATAEMPGGTYTVPFNFSVTSAVANAAIVEPVVNTDQNVIHNVAVMVASATIVPAEGPQGSGDENDDYATRIAVQSDTNDIWLRLNETEGTDAYSEITGLVGGVYYGAPTLGQFGLENRRVVTFDGVDDYIGLTDNDIGAYDGTMEVVFKTADGNGSLFYGADNIFSNANGSFVTNTFITEVGLEDGYVKVSFTGSMSFTGTKKVNDDRWHHLVTTWSGSRLNVFLDGVLHFSRIIGNSTDAGLIAVPDSIGKGFAGQIMEFVFHVDNVLDETDSIRNYYAAFGIVPVKVPVATASAEMTQGNIGKGNTRRVLALYEFGKYIQGYDLDNTDWTGTNDKDQHKYPTPDKSFPSFAGMRVSFKSVLYDETKMNNQYYLAGRYYDEVTGDPRFIDFVKDIDMSQYDAVFFINTPAKRNNPALFENMFKSLRKAQDSHGFGIYCPQPEVALELGIIDRVESHSMMKESFSSTEQGNAAGLYDARAALVNPWVKDATEAMYYGDTHALTRYRVTATMTDLTDLNGWIDEDYYTGRPRDPFKVSFWGWKYRELTNGLQIGDEFLYANQDLSAGLYASQMPDRRTQVFAVPPSAVKAGTVITRENTTHYIGTTEVENPYREYATTIAVEPGDSLNGYPVNGKIFVNFMDGFVGRTGLIQIVPPNEEISDPALHEDEEKREWQYSTVRVSTTSVSVGGATSTEQESTENAEYFQPNRNTTIVSVNEYERYPTQKIEIYGMVERGWNWLSQRVDRAPGDKVIRPAAATATATIVEPDVRGEKDVTINVQPALATAVIVDKHNADTNFPVLPMTARAEMTGYSKIIMVEPATALAEMIEQFDLVHATGEQVVLTLHYTDAILYLLEEN